MGRIGGNAMTGPDLGLAASSQGTTGARRSARIRYVAPNGDFDPIGTINTTPLIDVMLVLLVMFIIIVPTATHKVPLDLPQATPTDLPPPPAHRLDIAADGALSWDGAPIAAATLDAHLGALAADPARPELQLRADSEARYEQIDRILAQIGRARITRLGFVGNERYADAF
jgi:biopolymer transport protein ExbD